MFDLRHRINRILIKLSYRLGISRLLSMPKKLAIDPTNHCDLKCPLCPTGLGDKTVSRGLMKLDEFKPVINYLGKWLQSVDMYSWGEPLLNKSFVEMIRHSATEHNIRTITSLHLNNLSDEQVKGFVTSGLDKLIVSVDGATQEVYEQYRVEGNIEKVNLCLGRNWSLKGTVVPGDKRASKMDFPTANIVPGNAYPHEAIKIKTL